jgi:superfamily II DNA or RNA helicase
MTGLLVPLAIAPYPLAVAGLGVAFVLWVAASLRPAARARRRARRALSRVERARAAIGFLEQRGQRLLVEHGGAYADAAAEERLAAVPVQDLRALGAEKVRWSALEEAGLVTVRDLVGVTRRDLVAIKGIGPRSAQRLVRARRELVERSRSEPVPPPPVGFSGTRALSLVLAAHDALLVRDATGRAAGELDAALDDLRGRFAALKRNAALLYGLLGGRVGATRAAALEEARRLVDDVESMRAEGGLLAGAETAVAEVRGELADAPAEPELRSDHEERHPEYCATIEHALPERFAGLGGVRGGLPEEIVRRVEATDLCTDGLRLTLRGYQEFGARYLLAQGRALLGDEMGLGKTIESLAAIAHLAATGEGERFLVVSPASVLFNWAREVERLTDLDAFVLHGAGRDAALAAWLERGGVAITSFGTLRRLVPEHELPPVDVLVVDEAHYVKNPEAERTRATAALTRTAKRVVFLSGTPLENRLDEFRRLLALLRPEVAAAVARAGGPVGDGAVGREAFLREVAPVYLRRNQEDVLLELPERIEKEEWVELTPAGAEAYAAAVADGDLMAMRRAVSIGAGRDRAAKLLRLAEILEEHRATGRKVLVFSFFLDVLDAIEARFETHGRITGATPAKKRADVCDAFSAHAGHAVLLAQIQAAGVGLNLQAASAVVLVEPQWKPSTEEQAVARAHRMGQTRTVLVHRLLAADSVDERMRELVGAKRTLFEAFARGSSVKDASAQAVATGTPGLDDGLDVEGASEETLAARVLAAETARMAAPGH